MEQFEYNLSSYNYDLPEGQIAQMPGEEPGQDKLMIVDRFAKRKPIHTTFANIIEYLPDHSLLVANNSRVSKCRLSFKRKSGGRSEFLLLTPLPCIADLHCGEARVEGLLRPAARSRHGDRIYLDKDMELVIEEKGEYGLCKGRLFWEGNLANILEMKGKLPLPPYIHHAPTHFDENRYQTIYASKCGSVAAPTAGLHFTQDIKKRLQEKNIGWVELSLHVGYGTFSPVRVEDIRRHAMHPEYVEISSKAAQEIAKAKADRRAVIAIGTTSLRALEGVANLLGIVTSYRDFINIFIYPGKSFRIVDGLLTNFHLPKSTLLMLVSAFAGRENILNAYKEAIANNYRFFSYGDAMLIT